MAEGPHTPSAKRRGRRAFSCAECRRSKLKCDRTIPCQNCVKKGCQGVCPDGVHKTSREAQLQQRVTELEGLVAKTTPRSQPGESSHRLLTPATLDGDAQGAIGVTETWTLEGILGLNSIPHAEPDQALPPISLDIGQDEVHTISPLTLERPYLSTNQTISALSNIPLFPRSETASVTDILRGLPSVGEARMLVDAYQRFVAWNFGPTSRDELETLVGRAYSDTSSDLHLHQLGLLFAILAVGALHCLEYPPEEASAFSFASAATECLSHGDVFAHSTVAGLQCLTQLSHFHSVTEVGRRRGVPWPLWTLSVRMIQDMSLHRDDYAPALPCSILEERRQVFWECYSAEVMIAQCYSRPPMIRSSQYNVAFPAPDEGDQRNCEYRQLKYEFVKLIESLSDDMTNVRPPSYEAVIESYNKLLAFESNVPDTFRCPIPPPSASMPSPDRSCARDLTLTLQQYTLALNLSKAIVASQLFYYRKAIVEEPLDPFQSPFASALLSVLERLRYAIQVVLRLCELYPAVIARHWMFWYHLSTAALTLEGFVAACPNSPLTSFAITALSDASTACRIGEKFYSRLSDTRAWMSRLEEQARDRVNSSLISLCPVSLDHAHDIQQVDRYHTLLRNAGYCPTPDIIGLRPEPLDFSDRRQSIDLWSIMGTADDLVSCSVEEVLQQHHPYGRGRYQNSCG